MARRFYIVTRDLHLYAGLFLSPFLVVFAVSVFYLCHVRSATAGAPPPRLVSGFDIDPRIETLTGPDQVKALRPILDTLHVGGEVNFIRRVPKEHRLVIPVMLPGRESTVDLNLERRTAQISERDTGLSDALIHLHKMPGPHNVAVRGNSAYIRVWRLLADISTYGLLFLTFSGVYLWVVLKAERRIGLVLLALGGVSFFGLIYALSF